MYSFMTLFLSFFQSSSQELSDSVCSATRTQKDLFASAASSEKKAEIFQNWLQQISGFLNADKMTISSVLHFPIYKFDTLEELTQFKDSLDYPEMLSFAYDEVPPFNEVTAKYDEAFFSENTLLLVYVVASTGTYRFAVDTITGDGTGLCVHIAETTHAEVVTDDMAGWFITVAVPDSAAATYTEFDAVLAEGSDC